MSEKYLLLLKFGAIGDCVMAIPGAYAMYQAGHQVHWICGEAAAPVLALYPWIDLHVIDDRALLRGSFAQRIKAVFALWKLTLGRRYDVCAALYYDPRYRLLMLPVRASRKVLLSKTDRSSRLIPGRHHADEYARILLGSPDDVTPSQIPPLRAEGLPPNPHPVVPGTQRIVIVPGGARNMMRDDALRRWPVDHYVSVAEALLQRGYEVILTGGPDDAWTSPAFAHLAVTDLTGTLSLPQTIALFESADLTITHDTGPLHLAGLTATAVLAIFGPTDPRGRLPQRANCVALWGGEGFACRPCYDGQDFAPCHNNGCIQQITPAMVFTEAETLLTARRENRSVVPRVRTPRHTPVPAFTHLQAHR